MIAGRSRRVTIMRLATGFAVVGLAALAGCASAPTSKAPADAVTADAQQTATPAAARPKTCIVGTRICTKEQEVDPSVMGMSAEALGDAERGHPLGYSAPH
jgi:invasion protein IalB